MEERRKPGRYSTDFTAKYRLDEEIDWKECTVIDLSYEGMGIRLPTREEVSVSSTIQLKVLLPGESSLVDAKGTIRWIKEDSDGLLCGVNIVLIKGEGR